MAKQKLNFKNSVIRIFLAFGIIIGLLSIMFFSGYGPWINNKNLKGPYLSWMNDPKTTMTISWQTPEENNLMLVEYGNDSNYGSIKSVINEQWNIHYTELTGLKPNTTYHYRIISPTNNHSQLLEDHWFKTAPNGTQAFSFVAYGDSRPDLFGNSGHGIICNQISTTISNPAFVLHTGDYVFQSNFESQWDQFFWELKSIVDKAPLMATIGNHEYNEFGSDYGGHYFNYFHFADNSIDEFYYSFNYSNVHVVSLNISVSDDSIPEAQVNWLIDDLNKANASSDINWIIIFFHVPLYSSGAYGYDEVAIEAFEQIFIDYGVDLVLMGHDHQYERMYANGIQYIVTGGGGAELEVYISNNEYTQYSENIHHFCLIKVDGLTLNIKAISSLGATIDQITLTSKHPHS